MIALDTSALIAIILDEPEADTFAEVIARADQAMLGLPTLLETRMVAIGGLGEARAAPAMKMLLAPAITPVSFNNAHLEAAAGAFARFGKGLHPAALNFGDCMAYAIAKVAGCPLLYKGDDFARTDIRSAV